MKKFIAVLIVALFGILTFFIGTQVSTKEVITEKVDTVVVSYYDLYSEPEKVLLESPQENLYEVLMFYQVKHPDIAYGIAAIETGWFTSDLCVKYNNLFGLYDSKNKGYYHFDNWFESVIAYRDWVENKYESDEDYYKFLEELPYSTNKNYVSNLRKVVTQIKGMD